MACLTVRKVERGIVCSGESTEGARRKGRQGDEHICFRRALVEIQLLAGGVIKQRERGRKRLVKKSCGFDIHHSPKKIELET